MEEKIDKSKFQFLPPFLYHYTSIDAFTQIIKTKTFRFTKLSLLNDPTEGITEDFENSSKLVYCSSWTASSKDTIPLWKLYTDLKGIRIKMPVALFKIKDLPTQQTFRNHKYRISGLKDPVSIEYKVNGKIQTKRIHHIYGPDPITYIDDCGKDKIVEKFVLSSDSENPSTVLSESDIVDLNPVGLYKPHHWTFEEEWRYRITLGQLHPNNNEKASQQFSNMEFVNDYYDLPLSEFAFDNMEILLGPKTNDSTKQIIDALCQKFLIRKDISITNTKIRIR